jgi:hypothetical protein
MRLTIAFLMVCAFAGTGYSQIKIEGPKEATTGYRVKAKMTLDVTDPQVKCFPANDDWYAVQDLAGNKYIDFVPGKRSVPAGQKSQLYTFVIAGNKGNKTYLETWEITVNTDEEVIPPPVVPETAKSQIYKDLFAAYKVSPNAAALRLHVKLYTEFLDEVKADKYNTARGAGDALKSKFKDVKDLQSVEDVVADYLQKNVGASWNKAKLVTAMDVIVGTLKTIPE